MEWLLPLCWCGVIGVIWTSIVLGSGVWFWYLHKEGKLLADYPYDDEM